MLRETGASYLVGTPKSMLRQFERELLADDWEQVAEEVEVKNCAAPGDAHETFVLCRSAGRREKEKAMRERQVGNMEVDLGKLKQACERTARPLRSLGAAERRVGRIMQRYPGAARLFAVAVEADGTRLKVKIERREERAGWAELADGCYLLRTNLEGYDAQTLWRTYIGLTQIEDCFRIAKSDLGLRPIFHHREDRTQAHILVCFLAYVLWKTLSGWQKRRFQIWCG